MKEIFTTKQLQDWDKQYVWHPFTPMKLWLNDEPLVITRGEGVRLYDSDGKSYIDGVSSLWCNVHGHNHPYINNAIQQQLAKISHSTMLGLASEPSIILAKMLVDITPADLTKVFYSDSGATAVEIALKIAFQYWRNKGQTQKSKFIALKQSYHGDTMGSVSVGGISIFHEIFGDMTFKALFSTSPHPYRFDGSDEQCCEAALADMEQLLRDNADEVAAIIMEPLVQGAAGLIMHPPGFLAGVRKLANNYNVLMIADEVAVGFGKTGTMFACEQEQVIPDILCVAKGLTGGYLPVAATLTTQKVFDAFLLEPWVNTTFYHGHTYTGNALGCAAAIASIELFEKEGTLSNVIANSSLIDKYLADIAQLDHVGNVRQRGIMAAIELVEDKKTGQKFEFSRRIGAKLCSFMRKKGVLLRPLGDIIVIMPPLGIPVSELEELLDVVKASIRDDLPTILRS